MNTSLRSKQIRALVWKDSRQLFPLMAVLLATGLILELLWALLPIGSYWFHYVSPVLPFLLPALFCVGAPAVLVGQEIELRTIDWLTTLPIAPRRLIAVKLAVATGGLLLMWIVCGAFVLFKSMLTNTSNVYWLADFQSVSSTEWISQPVFFGLHSFYVLLCAFYCSWRFRNTLVGLIAVIPLAAIPVAITLTGYELREWATGLRWVQPGLSSLWAISVLAATCPVMYLFGRRAALLRLNPVQAKIPHPSASDLQTLTKRGIPKIAPFRFSLTSVCWQTIRQNRSGFAAVVGLMLLAVLGHMLRTTLGGQPAEWRGITLAIGALGVAWLGVLIFSGDGAPRRLRFLADRGVSPSLVWLGRQLTAASVLALIAIAGALYSLIRFRPQGPHELESTLSLATIVMLIAIIYSASQWITQICQMLAVSFVLAPFLSAALFGWIIFSATNLGTPFWLVLLLIAIPMLATWLSMRHYMDGHRGWYRWSIAAGTLLLIILLPALPLTVRYLQIPGIERQQRASWIAEARQTDTEPPELLRIVTDATGTAVDVRDVDRPAVVDPFRLREVLGEANLSWLMFQDQPDDAAAFDALTGWLETLSITSRRLRHNPDLLANQQADAIEIWLARLLDSSTFDPYRDRPQLASVRQRLSDVQFRNQSRRRAVLATWFASTDHVTSDSSQTNSQDYTQFNWNNFGSEMEQIVLSPRRIDTISSLLLEMIEAGKEGRSTEGIRRRLHRWVLGNSLEFQNGPYSDRFRAGKPNHSIAFSVDPSQLKFPGSQWYAGWEQTQ